MSRVQVTTTVTEITVKLTPNEAAAISAFLSRCNAFSTLCRELGSIVDKERTDKFYTLIVERGVDRAALIQHGDLT